MGDMPMVFWRLTKMVCVQIVCCRDLHGHDYLPQGQVCEMNCLYRTELVCEMNCLYRTELVCCDGVAEAVLLQPGAEPQRLARVLQHILVVVEKVCNQGCRKICQFHRDFLRDQYAAPGYECYNRCIRQESIL